MTRTPGGLTAAVIALVVMSLAGCTPAPGPVNSSAAPSPSPSDSASPSPTSAGPDPQAVVTIAAVDVDGLNATVSGYVTQVSEEGGQCVFTATSSVTDAVVTVEATGVANVSTTSCTTVQIPTDQLSKGTWEVELQYTSEDTDVTSDSVTMEVP